MSDPKELKIDAERVKEAAGACPDAARILKVIFPEVFEAPKPKHLKISKWSHLKRAYGWSIVDDQGRTVLDGADSYDLSGKGIYLDTNRYNFEIHTVGVSVFLKVTPKP